MAVRHGKGTTAELRLSTKSWLYGSEASVFNTDVMLSMMMSLIRTAQMSLDPINWSRLTAIQQDGPHCTAFAPRVPQISKRNSSLAGSKALHNVEYLSLDCEQSVQRLRARGYNTILCECKAHAKERGDLGQCIQKHLRFFLFEDENDVVCIFQINRIFIGIHLNARVLKTFQCSSHYIVDHKSLSVGTSADTTKTMKFPVVRLLHRHRQMNRRVTTINRYPSKQGSFGPVTYGDINPCTSCRSGPWIARGTPIDCSNQWSISFTSVVHMATYFFPIKRSIPSTRNAGPGNDAGIRPGKGAIDQKRYLEVEPMVVNGKTCANYAMIIIIRCITFVTATLERSRHRIRNQKRDKLQFPKWHTRLLVSKRKFHNRNAHGH
ncbi:hypothetical protein CLF_107975 [Clonorchis sinensis]|uniref:Uncharacterized protein n=1 Tax=Clonorchis sinensis TaxID=79923 RepID=G7YHF5_CLOSI|nr:hypothetical protein CLF_107975 [Clonorchis sinensis]